MHGPGLPRSHEEERPLIIGQLDDCVIHVSNWDRSNAVYTLVLGTRLVQNGEGWAYRFCETQPNGHGPGIEATPLARRPVAPGNGDLCLVWS